MKISTFYSTFRHIDHHVERWCVRGAHYTHTHTHRGTHLTPSFMFVRPSVRRKTFQVSCHEVQSVVFRFGFLFASSPTTKKWNCHHCQLRRRSAWSPAAAWLIFSIFVIFLPASQWRVSIFRVLFFFLSFFLIPKDCKRP